jgi:GxxExxY protein
MKKSRNVGEAIALQRVDMVVDHKVIVEIKCGERLAPSARKQLFNYLRATNLEVGLLLHFGPKPTLVREFNSLATH